MPSAGFEFASPGTGKADGTGMGVEVGVGAKLDTARVEIRLFSALQPVFEEARNAMLRVPILLACAFIGSDLDLPSYRNFSENLYITLTCETVELF